MPRRCTIELRVPEAAGVFSAYARMLETAATAASSEAGFSPDWYAAEGTAWVIRRSTIECAVPILRGSAVELVTWVADFRRVRSQREYEGRVAGELVLRGHTDWVYVERTTGKPRRIAEAMMRSFVPEGRIETMPRAVLAIGDPPPDAKSSQWPVEPSDVDQLDHVNNTKYFDWVEAMSPLDASRRPVAHDVEYLDEARAGDLLRGVAWITGSREATLSTATEIRRAADGVLLTRARSVWAS